MKRIEKIALVFFIMSCFWFDQVRMNPEPSSAWIAFGAILLSVFIFILS